MATVKIPDSLQSYYGNQAVRRAVDDLVNKLNGKGMPGCNWEEAKNYNQALLMAAQVRTDYVALLFDVWEATFGKSKLQSLKGDELDHKLLSPSGVWGNGWLWRAYSPSCNSDESERSYELCVYVVEDNLELRVYRYDQDGKWDCSETPKVERWLTRQDHNEEGPYLVNENVSLTDFVSEPDSAVERFAEDANNVVQMLLDT